MRRINPSVVAGIMAGILLAAAVATGEFSTRPVARWFADDQTLSFGNTAPTPDAVCQWETADASDHHLECNQDNTAADYVFAFDQNTDWGVTNASRLRVQAPDATGSKWAGVYHDNAFATFESGNGSIRFEAPSDVMQLGDNGETSSEIVVHSNAAAASYAALRFASGVSNAAVLRLWATAGQAQTVIGVDAAGGRHLVLADEDVIAKDFDHAATTDPTLFVHSALDPDTDNSRWMSLSHSGTAGAAGVGAIATGAGPVQFNAANDTVDLLTNANLLLGGSAVVKTTVNYNSVDPTNCATVADGYVVTGIWVEVRTVWDGNGTLEIGDDGDNDGFAAIPNAVLLSTGYKLTDHSDRGAYLWDGTSDRDRAYALADQVDCGPIPGTSTQGIADVYVNVMRLK